jgi:hypothetical protein
LVGLLIGEPVSGIIYHSLVTTSDRGVLNVRLICGISYGEKEINMLVVEAEGVEVVAPASILTAFGDS